MRLTGENMTEWRLEVDLKKLYHMTDDLSQYDWRRRRYDDFSQHKRHLQHSQTPDPLAGLLVLIELFSLGVTADTQRANIGAKLVISLQRGPVDPKFQ